MNIQDIRRAASPGISQDRPNILFITTDQQRFDTIHAAGYDFMKTPNLDRLAAEGCLYTNAYAPNPVCIPARHNILTGLSARFHGFDDNYFVETKNIPYQLPTFAQILSDDGYDTVGIGKLHFQPYRRHNGFHNIYLMDEIPRYREDDEYALFLKEKGFGGLQSLHGVRHLLYMLPQRSMVPAELHGSSWVADKTIAFLDENRGKRPFLCWSAFIHPHPPFDVPEDWADLYRGVDLPDPPQAVTPLSPLAEENKHIADYPTPDYLRRARELYYAAISFVDYNIGRILNKLEEIGQLDNTLIVFCSDHGEMMGDLGTYQKFLPYDGSAKIPMILRWPVRVEPGSRCEDFVDLNDLLPTFLDAAGSHYPADAPYDLPGASLLSSGGKDREHQYLEHCAGSGVDSSVEEASRLSGGRDREHQYLEHCRGNRRWCSMRDKRYKYNYYFGGGREELFDMVEDPGETTNLLEGTSTPEVQAARQDLHARLVAEELRQGLEGDVENGELVTLPPYVCKPYRETNYPAHVKNLVREEEIEALIPIPEEVVRALAHEPEVNLAELDLEAFRQFGGFSDAEVAAMLEARTKQLPPR